MRKKVTLPSEPNTDLSPQGDSARSASRSPGASEWLNHTATGVATEDIFAGRRHGRKRRLLLLPLKGVVLAGRGVGHVGRFSIRQMQPMRRRDWVTVSALVAVLLAMGAYMVFQRPFSDTNARLNCRWHVITAGDTLLTIARASGVTVGDIARANGTFDVNEPQIGQQICIPGNVTSAGASSSIPPASQTDGPVIEGEAAFVRFALPYARQAHDATGWPVSMILAQWGLEQGWQTPSFTGYNFGNCGGVPEEPFVPGTAAPGSPATFAYADTPEDGLRIYIGVARLSYYDQVAAAASQGGPIAAARALGASPWDAGHYTDHNAPGSSLIALMQTYNLQQYD